MQQFAFSYYKSLWSWRKAGNTFFNLTSYYISRLTRQYIVWGKPFTLFIEPTNRCNLACRECPVGLKLLQRPQGLMDFSLYKTIIDQTSDHLWYLLLYFQGEPAIHPQLIQMIEYAYRRKIFTVISTNGTRLANKQFSNELAASHLGKVIISLDGASEQTYRIYRREGLFYRVVEGIKNLAEARQRLKKSFPQIVIQFLVMRHNEHEIETIRRLGKTLGVDDVILKSPQIYDFENAEDILPENPRFRRYKKVNGSYHLKGSYSGYCRKLWIGSVITQDGTVVPCCFDKDADFPLGNLTKNSFSSIWHSSGYHQFRKKVIKHRRHIPICQNCTEGLKIFFK